MIFSHVYFLVSQFSFIEGIGNSMGSESLVKSEAFVIWNQSVNFHQSSSRECQRTINHFFGVGRVRGVTLYFGKFIGMSFDEEIIHWWKIALYLFSFGRNINGFLNTGKGGTIYLGIVDNGSVKGLNLTLYQVKYWLTYLSRYYRSKLYSG